MFGESPARSTSETTKGRPKATLSFSLYPPGYWWKIGAGEAIRTPDPNLGKVMLYP